MVTKSLALLVALALLQCSSRHYLGSGGSSPDDLITRFIAAYSGREYLEVRELVLYDEPCFGFMGTSINPNKESDLLAFYDDHLEAFETSSARTDFVEKLKLTNESPSHPLAPFLTRGHLVKLSKDSYQWTYPAPFLGEGNQVLGEASSQNNRIDIRQHQGRWYIYNPQCQAFSGVLN